MKKIFTVFTALVLCFLFALTGCGSDITSKRKIYEVFATYAELVISDCFDNDGAKRLTELDNEITIELEKIENSLSLNVSDSCINAFNDADAGESVKVDKIAYDVINRAKELYVFTDGYFNPAVYYSLNAYGFYQKQLPDILPTDEELQVYTDIASEFGNVVCFEQDGEYFIKKPQKTVEWEGTQLSLKIDLGGIGKGYASDCVNEIISKYGFEYGYFLIGKSSVSVKQSAKTKNGEWTLSLTHPRSQSQVAYAKTSVKNVNVSTSGDYENYFERDGVRYCHVINAKSGLPTNTGIITATVIGGTATSSDAISTALMCMSLTDAVSFMNDKLKDYVICMVYDDGAMKIITNSPQLINKVANDMSFYSE